MATYSGLGHRLRTYAAIPLMAALAVGCGGGEPPKPTQEAQKPPVSKTLEQKAAEAPTLVDRDLIERYKEFVEVYTSYQKKIEESVAEFAKRSGIKPEEVKGEDYNAIARPVNEEMKKNPKVQRILNLSGENARSLARLVNENIDMGNVRRMKGDLYLQGNQEGVRAFYDPELTIPAGISDYLGLTVKVSNPRVYKTKIGVESVDIGKGYWVRLSDFGPKPGEYVRKLYQEELNGKQEQLAKLKDILKKIKPSMTPEQVTKILDESRLGEGLDNPEELKSYIAELEKESQVLQKVLALK